MRTFPVYAALRPLLYQQRRTWMSTAGIEKSHTAMLFPGQGAQYVGMGKDLYDTFKEARAVFDEADHVLGINLVNLIFDGEQEKLKLTENAQPAILTTSIAIVRVLEECFGFKVEDECTYTLGHSLGEYSALVAAKSLSLGDAVRLVRARGQAMQKSVGNQSTAMSALVMRRHNLRELTNAMEEVQKDLPAGELVELANINSSFQVVISGTGRGVDIASQYLQQKNLAARAVDLPVSAPFHCSLMKEAAEEMEKALAKINFADPIVKVISNVTGKPIQDANEIPPLLVRQVTSTVQWHNSIKYLKDNDIDDFIVFGPGRVLANLLKKEYPIDRVRPTADVESIHQLGNQALHKKDGGGDKTKT